MQLNKNQTILVKHLLEQRLKFVDNVLKNPFKYQFFIEEKGDILTLLDQLKILEIDLDNKTDNIIN